MPLYFMEASLLRCPGIELNEYKNERWEQIAHLYCGNTLRELCSAACDAYWNEAIADLERGRILVPSDDVGRHYALDMNLASARIGLGFLAIDQARLDDAQVCYEESKEIVDRHVEGHGKKANFRKLEERLAELNLKIHADLSAAR